jgi:hypothetical protein
MGVTTAAPSAEIPHTRLINFVDQPATIKYSQFGEAEVQLNAPTGGTGGILDIRKFRKVHICVGSTKAASFQVFMGKISGPTLSEIRLVVQPPDHKVHTLEVVGPEMTLWFMGGTPNTQEQVQLWVYLSS